MIIKSAAFDELDSYDGCLFCVFFFGSLVDFLLCLCFVWCLVGLAPVLFKEFRALLPIQKKKSDFEFIFQNSFNLIQTKYKFLLLNIYFLYIVI